MTLAVPLERPQAGPRSTTRIDPRWYSSSLLTLILVIGQWRYQILGDSYLPWFVALSTAILTEVVAWKLVRPGWPNILSAYISGNSVAILLKPLGDVVWPFAVCAAVSILSKYVLAWRGRHLWNPTNFGVCALLALVPSQVAMLGHQWGNALGTVAILWGIGLLTVWRARVLHLTLAWLAAFVFFAWIRALILPEGRFVTEVAPVTGPMYQLFMFFMITDPKTVVRGRGKQIAVVVAVAAAECVVRLLADFHLIGAENPLRYAPPMYALFLVGPPALIWQLWRSPEPERAPATAASG
jgi:enediyne biosynthesis protein E5